jgi:hypothetical protein
MTKVYVVISAALLVAMLFGSMIFAEGGAKLTNVSWNSLPTLNWTADGKAWNG